MRKNLFCSLIVACSIVAAPGAKAGVPRITTGDVVIWVGITVSVGAVVGGGSVYIYNNFFSEGVKRQVVVSKDLAYALNKELVEAGSSLSDLNIAILTADSQEELAEKLGNKQSAKIFAAAYYKALKKSKDAQKAK
jgi:hypothetical protein